MNNTIEYPPGPKDLFPYTIARKFLRDPLKTLTNLSETYGDISHFKFGKQDFYFLNNPNYIEEVLVTNYKNFIKSRGVIQTSIFSFHVYSHKFFTIFRI